MRILITSGPTRAPIDEVRFLTNRSSGRLGALMAEEALLSGAQVTMIFGSGSEVPPNHRRLKIIGIETNGELKRALKRELKRARYDIVIHAMAVLDFEPKKARPGKRSSREGEWTVGFVPTPKIINEIRRWSLEVFLVGFKLEVVRGRGVARLLGRARRLLKESQADLIVANPLPKRKDSEHVGYFVRRGSSKIQKVIGKRRLANTIIRLVMEQKKRPRS